MEKLEELLTEIKDNCSIVEMEHYEYYNGSGFWHNDYVVSIIATKDSEQVLKLDYNRKCTGPFISNYVPNKYGGHDDVTTRDESFKNSNLKEWWEVQTKNFYSRDEDLCKNLALEIMKFPHQYIRRVSEIVSNYAYTIGVKSEPVLFGNNTTGPWWVHRTIYNIKDCFGSQSETLKRIENTRRIKMEEKLNED